MLFRSLANCVAQVESLALKHEVRIQTDVRAPAHLLAMADPQRLQQVFLNLLTNGCKYNRPGGMLMAAVDSDGQRLTVSFTDQGAGLTAEDIQALFKPFQRIDRTAQRVEGSGLGLCIAQQLLQAMGGDISVSSRVGEGSCFQVHLALAKPAAQVTAETEALPV